MLRVVVLAALLAAPAGFAREAAEPDPGELSLDRLRVIAIERGPEGDRAWLADAEDSFRFPVAAVQVFRVGELREVRWEDGSVLFWYEKDDPNGRLLKPWLEVVRVSTSVVHGEPFGNEGCPDFLLRVEAGAAVVRVGSVGQERALRVGDELCQGWTLEALRPTEGAWPGLVTLRRGDRRLRVAESPTVRPSVRLFPERHEGSGNDGR